MTAETLDGLGAASPEGFHRRAPARRLKRAACIRCRRGLRTWVAQVPTGPLATAGALAEECRLASLQLRRQGLAAALAAVRGFQRRAARWESRPETVQEDLRDLCRRVVACLESRRFRLKPSRLAQAAVNRLDLPRAADLRDLSRALRDLEQALAALER